MIKIDYKGQAFSTFQILIAAVVAIVILTILLSILGIIPFPFLQEDPTQAARDALTNAYSHLTTHVKTGSVTFHPGYTMLARSIVVGSNVAIEEKQLCLSLGDFSQDTETWSGDPEKGRIAYKGNVPKKVRLSLLCDVGERLKDTLDLYGEESGLSSSWVDECPCITSTPKEVCCVIALRYNIP